MKKKMKRILAAVVTFVMLLGSLPVYAAGGDAERTGNDESASFWLQEYDLNSGLETDKVWYPDESGLIEVPLLDRTTKNNSPLQSYTEYGIALKDVNGLDAYNLYLDFNGIRENSDYDYSTTNYGTFGISADLKAALDSALSQQGSAEFKIEYKGATYTVRLLNEHDQGEQPEEPDQTEAVQHVIELINAIGEVTKESDDAINAAPEAYDSRMAMEGAWACSQSGLGRAAFSGRILKTLGKRSHAEVQSYLLGAALALDVQAMEAFLPDQPEEIPMPDIVIPLHRNLGAALGVAPDMNGPREIVEPRIYVAGKAPVQQAMIDVLEALGHEGAIAVPRELSARMGVVGAAEIGL